MHASMFSKPLNDISRPLAPPCLPSLCSPSGQKPSSRTYAPVHGQAWGRASGSTITRAARLPSPWRAPCRVGTASLGRACPGRAPARGGAAAAGEAWAAGAPAASVAAGRQRRGVGQA